jgi:hypothetical protein
VPLIQWPVIRKRWFVWIQQHQDYDFRSGKVSATFKIFFSLLFPFEQCCWVLFVLFSSSRILFEECNRVYKMWRSDDSLLSMDSCNLTPLQILFLHSIFSAIGILTLFLFDASKFFVFSPRGFLVCLDHCLGDHETTLELMFGQNNWMSLNMMNFGKKQQPVEWGTLFFLRSFVGRDSHFVTLFLKFFRFF